MMTIPAYLYGDIYNYSVNPLMRLVEHASDGVLEIESFSGIADHFYIPLGSPKQVDERYTSDYHGLIHPIRLFPIHSSIQTTRLDQVQLHSLGFKVRRKRFLIETFTLPPEEEEKESDHRSKHSSNARPKGSDRSTEKEHSTLGPSKVVSDRSRLAMTGCGSNKDPLDF